MCGSTYFEILPNEIRFLASLLKKCIIININRFVLAVMIIEAGWLSAGIAWLVNYYLDCPVDKAKDTVLGMYIFTL